MRATDDDAEAFAAFQEKVRDTNINVQTLLATDYLNHFNEVVMLLGMLPDMPDCLDDVKEWRPKSYREHFRDSCVADRDLAIAAYDHVPARFRVPFEDTIDKLNRLIASTVRRAEAAVEAGDTGLLHDIVHVYGGAIRSLQDTANAIIHGSDGVLHQTDIDNLLGDGQP
jgi:hypothetical protein